MHPDILTVRCSQGGSTLVVVLLVIMSISILGIMSMNISSVELDISHNERLMREDFYLLESAALEGIQRLVDAPPIDLEDKFLFWHHAGIAPDQGATNFRDSQQWRADGGSEDNAMQSTLDPQSHFAAVEHRLATGSSAIVTEPRLYMNRVFGLCTRHKAVKLVEVGYQLRY
jgi:hypothetical protein